MPRVEYAPALTRHVACPPQDVAAATLREALLKSFEAAPGMRNYVLDEQGRLRKHVCIFLDGERLAHSVALAATLQPQSEIYVMQALSGG